MELVIPMLSPPSPKMNLPSTIMRRLSCIEPKKIVAYPKTISDIKIFDIFLYPAKYIIQKMLTEFIAQDATE
jgi:hypothetical protein